MDESFHVFVHLRGSVGTNGGMYLSVVVVVLLVVVVVGAWVIKSDQIRRILSTDSFKILPSLVTLYQSCRGGGFDVRDVGALAQQETRVTRACLKTVDSLEENLCGPFTAHGLFNSPW